jgi:pyruvate/2-oxoglutarate dehydrogenase complex dihydrolipoamide dehydrogenase (E3) component
MDELDFVIIGAGAAGEAAAHEARRRKASVAIVDRDLFGGSCPFWACMPSKSLLHSASVQAVGGPPWPAAASGAYPWPKAAAQRDYMIVREHRDYPDDGGHVHELEKDGAQVLRGSARILGPGRVEVTTKDGPVELRARNLVLALGTNARIPPIEGIETVNPWTNREATSAETLPKSFLVLGGGPTGVELAQVYARYGVQTTIVEHNTRLLARDHPRNSAAVEQGLRAEGVTVRTGVRALRARAGAGPDGAHAVDLDQGPPATGHAVLLAIGRQVPLDGLGLETLGLDISKEKPWPIDGRLRIGDGLWVIGDPAGPEMHTHTAHYQGELAVRMALGDQVTPDYSALPRCTYTDPEAAFVGLALDEAQSAGHDAFELVQDLATTAKGYVAEASGHVTIVVDRTAGLLLGVAIAGPGATEAIHEAVLAIKTRTPIAVLADTIHAFPTVARVLGGLFVEAARELGLQ